MIAKSFRRLHLQGSFASIASLLTPMKLAEVPKIRALPARDSMPRASLCRPLQLKV
jgi:hypothetical protein